MFHKLVPFTSLNKDQEGFILSASLDLGPRSSLLTINYKIVGKQSQVHLPPLWPFSSRADGLWEETCFELFIRFPGEKDYFEFNFSPKGHWNCFNFTDYRTNKTEYTEVNKSIISVLRNTDQDYQLKAIVDLSTILKDRRPAYLEYHATTVIRFMNGSTHYFAISHPDDTPNFHHPKNFSNILQLQN